MATITNNFLVEGLRGMLGKTVVFRTVRGKTVVSNRPAPPKKESEQQRANRGKFKEATQYAKHVLLDAAKKEYYQKRAKKLKLPNAYTAAITDYMRKPIVTRQDAAPGGTSMIIQKKDFSLATVAVVKKDEQGIDRVVRAAVQINNWQWKVVLADDEMLKIKDEVGNVFRYGALFEPGLNKNSQHA